MCHCPSSVCHHGNLFPIATRTQETDEEAAESENEISQDEDEVTLTATVSFILLGPLYRSLSLYQNAHARGRPGAR